MDFRFLIINRFFRQARRELREAKTDLVRQHEETISLLQETAKRHTQSEISVDGRNFFFVVATPELIVVSASNPWFPPFSMSDLVVLTMNFFQDLWSLRPGTVQQNGIVIPRV